LSTVRLWKLLGVAGLAGVAATGAVLARNERQRRAYTPEDVRARLHERASALDGRVATLNGHPAPPAAPSRRGGLRDRLRALRRRRPGDSSAP
jgi:hypothetical protein